MATKPMEGNKRVKMGAGSFSTWGVVKEVCTDKGIAFAAQILGTVIRAQKKARRPRTPMWPRCKVYQSMQEGGY